MANTGVSSRTLFSRWIRFADAAQKTEGLWFIFGLLAITGWAIAITPQGRDLVRAVIEDGANAKSASQWVPLFMLYVSAVYLGLQAWFWARVAVELQFGAREKWASNLLLAWAPRLFGLIPFGFLTWAVAESKAAAGIESAVIVLSLLSIAFLVLMIFHDIWRRRASRHENGDRARAALLTATRLRYIVLVSGLVLAIAGLAIVLKWPVAPALLVGAAAVVLLSISFIIPPMSILIQLASVWRFPLTLALIVLAFVFSFFNDNHALEIRNSDAWHSRPLASNAWRTWRAQASSVNGSVPVIFVAAEGGASRAGFWTGHALGALEDRTKGDFSKHVFLMSSISGSSLATAAFVATLRDNPALASSGGFGAALDDFTGRDYLSPTLAGMLFPDLLQRLIPWDVLPDRAFYLERAWEDGWAAHCTDTRNRCHYGNILSSNYLDLWHSGRWMPVLAIGGAREEDGRRILSSNVYFAGNQIDADDFHTLATGDVSVSTAMLNGARFPYISPAGRLPEKAGGHILDGGYFDTAGVETLREAAEAALASDAFDAVPPGYAGIPLRPIFILLENGQPSDSPQTVGPKRISVLNAAPNAAEASAHMQAPPVSRTDAIFPDVIGPLVGLLASRDAHAAHLRYLLEQAVRRASLCAPPIVCPERPPVMQPELIEIQVCSRNLPLDWILSESVREEMKQEMDNPDPHISCGNKAKIDHIAQLLGH